MAGIVDDDIESIRKKLKSCTKNNIIYSRHFNNQIVLREGSKEQVADNLLNPDKLVYSYQEKGDNDETIHCLYFRLSNTRTLKLPVIFDRGNKKNLYIITCIMRHRFWQSMVRKG